MVTPGEPGSEHRRYEQMAVAHVLGGLSPEHQQTFRSHLLGCAECRASVGELQAIAHELADVEQNETRERAAQTVELKELETQPHADDNDGLSDPVAAKRWRRVRLFGVIGLVAFVLLGIYTFTLHGAQRQLHAQYEDRLEAAAALEHGQTLPTRMAAPGVTATAKRNDEHLVLLMEGLEGDRAYGLYLLGDASDGEEAPTLSSQPQEAQDGSILVLTELTGDERSLVVTEVDGAFDTSPHGRRMFEASIPGAETGADDVSRAVGSPEVPRVSSPSAH